MKIGAEILTLLNKPYPADQMIEQRFGDTIWHLKLTGRGDQYYCLWARQMKTVKSKGERFARRLQTDKDGTIIKDHWDNKGKAG